MFNALLDIAIVAGTYVLVLGPLPRILGRLDGVERARGRRSSWPVIVLSGVLLAIGLQVLVSVLELSAVWLALSLWAFLFIVGFLLSAIEGIVFTAGPSPVRPADLLGALLMWGIIAGVTALVMESAAAGSVVENLRGYLKREGAAGTALRIGLSATSFMVAYNVLGSLIWPLVRSYYTGPDSTLRLRIPSAKVIIPLQLGRGLLATLVLMPIFTAMTVAGVEWWVRVSVCLVIVGSVVPLLNAPEWPWKLRLIHLAEIAVFYVVQSFAWWKLVGS